MAKKRAYRKAARIDQIMRYALNAGRSEDSWWTIHGLARHLDITPSTKLRRLVNSLLHNQQLEELASGNTGAVKVKYMYRISAATEKAWLKARASQMKIKVNGKSVDGGF